MKTKMYLFIGFIMLGVLIYKFYLQSLNIKEPPSYQETISIIFCCAIFLCSLMVWMPNSKKTKMWRITVRLALVLGCVLTALLIIFISPNSSPLLISLPIFIPSFILSFINLNKIGKMKELIK